MTGKKRDGSGVAVARDERGGAAAILGISLGLAHPPTVLNHSVLRPTGREGKRIARKGKVVGG